MQIGPALDRGKGGIAQPAPRPRHEHDLPAHGAGTVCSPMRPVTTFVLLALLVLILIAGTIFVVQLLSVS